MWGGGFSEEPADAAMAFTVDRSDARLLPYDVQGSRAHVDMLAAKGLIDETDASALREGLAKIQDQIDSGQFSLEGQDEDVHSAVERRLYELIGSPAGKLHTGRSRNDQVALDLRLYLRDVAANLQVGLRGVARTISAQARTHRDTVSPAYTHMQQSQPISFGHHLLAHVWPLTRDIERLGSLSERLVQSPLGAGASAGSSLGLAPEMVAEQLGFATIFDNSLDAIASRDVAAEFVYCCAQSMANLSRFAAELVLWASIEFGWVTIADAYSTGSSAMPQKKNPDVAELVRGKSASVAADVSVLLGIQHGLPLSYNRDLQEDKRAIFHAADSLAGAIAALDGMVGTADFHPRPPGPNSAALDIAEALVRDGVPFREAHRIVGELVGRLGRDGRTLAEATDQDLAGVSALISPDHLASPSEALTRRATPGSGTVESVDAQLKRLDEILA